MLRCPRDRQKIEAVNSAPSRSTLFHCGLASADLVRRRGEEERKRREEAKRAEDILKVLEGRKWKEWVDAWKRSYKGMAGRELKNRLQEGGRLLPLPPMGLGEFLQIDSSIRKSISISLLCIHRSR